MISTLALFLLTVVASTACSVGFWVACTFDGDETYDRMGSMYPHPKPENPMLLWWVRWYGRVTLPRLVRKPLYECLPCMGSVHSLYPLLIFNPQLWYLWPVVAIATVGVNYLITIWWNR